MKINNKKALTDFKGIHPDAGAFLDAWQAEVALAAWKSPNELKQKYGCRVVAPHDKSAKIANADLRACQGDVVKVGGLLARVLETPGHTLDHISYVFLLLIQKRGTDSAFSQHSLRVTKRICFHNHCRVRSMPSNFGWNSRI